MATDKANPLKLLDDHIGEHLRAKQASDLEQWIRLRLERFKSSVA